MDNQLPVKGALRRPIFPAALVAVAASWLCPIAVAAAQSPTAGDAISAHQRLVQQAVRPECPKSPAGEEIIVCGSRNAGARYRVPFPPDPPEGARIAGEAPSAAAQMDHGAEPCSPNGLFQSCPYIDLLGVAIRVVATVAKAIEESK